MWKTIPSFSNYEASSTGKIRNKSTGRILAGKQRWDGYLEYNLSKNGKGFSRKGHKLVASAFGIRGEVIDHKNGKRTDNRVSNLRGVSRSENNKNTRNAGYQNNSKKRTYSSKKSK